MKYELIRHNESNRRLIAIFLGWAMDDKPFRQLNREGFDIVLFFDYADGADNRDIFHSIANRYDLTEVIAWSYGVAIAERICNDNTIRKIAVNGTPDPVNDRFGIPRHIFGITLRKLNEANMKRFYSSTGFSPDHVLPERSFEGLVKELEMFGNLTPVDKRSSWSKAYIASNDSIIPPKNQINAWEGTTSVTIVDNGVHLPDFQAILDNDIIDKNLVARRFTDKADEYDENATVQRDVALRLMGKWNEIDTPQGKTIIELGCGTGFLTSLYTPFNPKPDSITVDIADRNVIINRFEKKNIKFNGSVICADAEKFIAEREENSADAIVSSSTIQWFENLPEFFRNVAKVLRSGGLGVFSTFAEGTFVELKRASGRTLCYPTADSLATIIPDCCDIIFSEVDSSKLTFKSGRELMNHIKSTGVNSVGAPAEPGKTLSLLRALDSDPTLTYRPLYLIIRKK